MRIKVTNLLNFLSKVNLIKHKAMQVWRRQWQPTPVFLPGESLGQRSLVGCCPWGGREWDTTEATEQDIQMLMIIFLVAVHLFK